LLLERWGEEHTTRRVPFKTSRLNKRVAGDLREDSKKKSFIGRRKSVLEKDHHPCSEKPAAKNHTARKVWRFGGEGFK